MKISHKTIEFQTQQELDFIDLTEEIKKFVQENQIKNGFLNIQILHTTASLLLNENEPLLLEDFKTHLERLSSKNLEYHHNDFKRRAINVCPNECKNGHSHCRALHFPSSLTLNIIGGEIQLGQWQRIFLLELDRPRLRKIQIQIMGE